MKIERIDNQCTGCGACYSVCPKSCIKMKYNAEGFFYPHIDKSVCVKCGKCEQVCHCLTGKKYHQRLRTFYGWANDAMLRKNSSSGGIFLSLAKYITELGGVVFASAFDYEHMTLVVSSSDIVDIQNGLAGSKYVESYMGKIIQDIQKEINSGRAVLFCGTPCQVSGALKLINDPNGLFTTVDFICHGVPSQKIFFEYIKDISKGRKVKKIEFRSKEYGWSGKNFHLKLELDKNLVRSRHYLLDPFYYGFMIKNAFLRKSCYECSFVESHCADITIADYWRYSDVNGLVNDEKGISLLIANTKKGSNLICSVDGLEIVEIDKSFSDYAFRNRDYSMFLSIRNKFYSWYYKKGFRGKAIRVFYGNKLRSRLRYLLRDK